METCVWIANIKNCKLEYLLYKLSIISLVFISVFIIILSILTIFYLKKNNYKFKTNFLDLTIIDINEMSLITILSIYFFRIGYLLCLIFSNKIHKSITLFIDIIAWIISIYIGLLLCKILCNIINNTNNNLLKIFKLVTLFNIIPILFSIISGYFFQAENYKKGHILLSLEYISISINMIFLGIIQFYYYKKCKKILKSYNIYKNIEKRIIASAIGYFLQSFLFIVQSIWMSINWENYENNNFIIFISVMYYIGSWLFIMFEIMPIIQYILIKN